MTKPHILFISKGIESASTRYRGLTFFDALRADGWQPIHLTAGHHPRRIYALLRAVSRASVVVVLRKTFNPLVAYSIRRCAKRLIFDFDDAVYVRSNGEISKRRLSRFKRMSGLCDQIWAGNQHLEAAAMQFNSRCKLLPTVLDPARYRIADFGEKTHMELVWIGSRSTRKYLLPLIPVLEGLVDALPKLRLNIISDFSLHSERLEIRCVPWTSEGETEEIAKAHIGIAPTADNPWTQGKCGLKILQYMAAGLPVVASPVGANREIMRPGVTGDLAATPEQWHTALARLFCDYELIARYGKAGRERLTEHYTVNGNYQEIRRSIEPYR